MTYSVPHDDARGCIPPTPWLWDTGRHLHLREFREGCFGLRQTAEKESFGQGFLAAGATDEGDGWVQRAAGAGLPPAARARYSSVAWVSPARKKPAQGGLFLSGLYMFRIPDSENQTANFDGR